MRRVLSVLAPAIVAAVPWNGPEPTSSEVTDRVAGWTPKPTNSPSKAGSLVELFKRDDYDNTCGYVGGISTSELVCGGNYVCATNSNYGVAGCCNPFSMDSCPLATSCVPGSDMEDTCTGANCLTDPEIAKCTFGRTTHCYEWHYDLSSTTVTEYGCTDVPGLTSVVELTYRDGSSTAHTSGAASTTNSNSASQTSDDTTNSLFSSTSSSSGSRKSKSNSTGAIIGGVIGGIVIICIAIGTLLITWCKNKRGGKAFKPGPTIAPNSTIPGQTTTPIAQNATYQPLASTDTAYPPAVAQQQYGSPAWAPSPATGASASYYDGDLGVGYEPMRTEQPHPQFTSPTPVHPAPSH